MTECANNHSRELQWLVDMYAKGFRGKTLVYVQTIAQCRDVWRTMAKVLDDQECLFVEGQRRVKTRLVNMVHAKVHPSTRRQVLDDFVPSDRALKIVVATPALCMGLDVRAIALVIDWGASSTVPDFWQKAGRAGRDGAPAVVASFIFKASLKRSNKDFSDFIKEPNCLRKRLLKILSANGEMKTQAENINTPELCCSNCYDKTKSSLPVLHALL